MRSGLAKCCKGMSDGNSNWEVLCLHHVQSFEGFLDMIEDPYNNDDDEMGHSQINTTWSSNTLLKSHSCPDKHWTPVTHWRMEHEKYYKQLNFIGHLEAAQWHIHRLLNKLHPMAWATYGASGWGEFRNESIFASSSTVRHATKSGEHLFEYYTSQEIERRVEKIYQVDYDNGYLDLDRVKIGEASSYYKKRYLKKWGDII